MKKVFGMMMALLMVLSLAACGETAETSEPESTTEVSGETEVSEAESTDTSDETFVIGICQLVQHPALDAATQGFEDAVTEALGDRVTFDLQNASGDASTCGTIVNGFVSSNVDLILANATSPLQAAASATSEIPILGTSVTDYATALEIDNWTGTVGGNISGASDLAPLDQQAAMIQELFPDAENIGLLYCSAEANSQFQVDQITGLLEAMGYTCTPFAFTDSNDVAAVTQTACDSSDVIYIPTDNTAASNTEAIANVVLPAKVPVVAGEEGLCKGCGVVTLTIDYYELGRTTGEMAVQILTGEADISTMPIQYAPNVTKEYNAANCAALGITVPEGYTAIEE
ncbi:MAG TPA: ABC transporter substrate binding protein [Oscillospiraceae bacterium]|nr:ABC transporter substrate binding protein [Oscillospiraceae bacterium]HXK77756.1 ABC transporter substrate binding protein [Oscillospiraceae bacterium]